MRLRNFEISNKEVMWEFDTDSGIEARIYDIESISDNKKDAISSYLLSLAEMIESEKQSVSEVYNIKADSDLALIARWLADESASDTKRNRKLQNRLKAAVMSYKASLANEERETKEMEITANACPLGLQLEIVRRMSADLSKCCKEVTEKESACCIPDSFLGTANGVASKGACCKESSNKGPSDAQIAKNRERLAELETAVKNANRVDELFRQMLALKIPIPVRYYGFGCCVGFDDGQNGLILEYGNTDALVYNYSNGNRERISISRLMPNRYLNRFLLSYVSGERELAKDVSEVERIYELIVRSSRDGKLDDYESWKNHCLCEGLRSFLKDNFVTNEPETNGCNIANTSGYEFKPSPESLERLGKYKSDMERVNKLFQSMLKDKIPVPVADSNGDCGIAFRFGSGNDLVGLYHKESPYGCFRLSELSPSGGLSDFLYGYVSGATRMPVDTREVIDNYIQNVNAFPVYNPETGKESIMNSSDVKEGQTIYLSKELTKFLIGNFVPNDKKTNE